MKTKVATTIGALAAIATLQGAPALAETPSPPGEARQRASIRAAIDRGLAAAAVTVREDRTGVVSLGVRDTLYLYDLVYGNVKVIATSPRGELVRQGRAVRLVAISGLPARRFEAI